MCKQSVCHIGNIEVKRPAVELDFDNTRIIEAMDFNCFDDIFVRFGVYIIFFF